MPKQVSESRKTKEHVKRYAYALKARKRNTENAGRREERKAVPDRLRTDTSLVTLPTLKNDFPTFSSFSFPALAYAFMFECRTGEAAEETESFQIASTAAALVYTRVDDAFARTRTRETLS